MRERELTLKPADVAGRMGTKSGGGISRVREGFFGAVISVARPVRSAVVSNVLAAASAPEGTVTV